MTPFSIAKTSLDDVPALQIVVEGTGLFPKEMLPDLLTQENALWLTCHLEGAAAGLCYAVPEPMAEGTWNLRALAVHPARQGEGAGTALVGALEKKLKATGQRILIVDTSGSQAFDAARQFYLRAGFVEAARLRDFWAAGDDKVTFWNRV